MKQSADLPGLRLFGSSTGDGETPPEIIPPANEGATAPAGEEAASDAGKNRSEARQKFRALMEGEYKQEFTAYFNEVFAKRFKEQKGLLEELNLARAVVDAAAARYGVSEVGKLPDAIRADSAVTASTEATAKEPTEETTVTEPVAAPANAAVPAATEKTESAAELDRRIRETVERAVADARAETERALTETILARGIRPAENALSPLDSGSRTGVSRLTRAERAAVALRAAQGERIEL